jgi:hypothetical protein
MQPDLAAQFTREHGKTPGEFFGTFGRTGWEPRNLAVRLKETVPGSPHDRLDAFMAAWIATLRPEGRRALGDAQQPDDAIWVPL